MNRRYCSAAAAVLLFMLATSGAFAQQAEADTAGAPAETSATAPAIKPIPAEQLADRALDAAAMLRNATIEIDFRNEIQLIQDDFSIVKKQIEELHGETLQRMNTGGPVSLFEEAEKEWSRLQVRLDRWLRTLFSRADTVGSALKRIRAEKALWMLTRDSLLDEELPAELKQGMREVLDAIEETEQRVRSSRDSILNFQASVGDAKALADQILADQREEIRERRRNILRKDSEPLWTALAAPGVGRSLFEEISATWASNRDAVRDYFSTQRSRSLRYLVSFLILVAGLIFLQQKGRVWVQQDRSLEPALTLLERPIAAGVILIVLFEDLLDPHAPTAWSTVLGLLLLLAVLRLLPCVLVTTDRSWAYILVTLSLLHQMARLTPDGTVLHRTVLLLLALTGFASVVWLVRKMRVGRSDIPPGWLRFIRLVARAAAVLFVVGVIANIAGSVGLSMVVVTGTLRAILSAVVLLVAAVLLRALIRVVMLLQPVRRLGVVSQRGDITRQTLFRAITVLAVLVWVTVALRGFMILDSVVEFVGAVVNVELSLGKFTLTTADVLIFAFVIWLSFKLARVICFALDADVLPHMHLPRGVPNAVTRLTRYAVIVVGVIVAFSAAGFSVDRITIVFGALSVGIGFGLQNVVSNFVSGLILLFERPIKVGDRVELATVGGVVMDIGMRASTVRSYSGADIVVPNANLISAEVVNWTLRDRIRRVEINVGVAYGTDPATVLDILVDLATKHPHVDDNPAPEAVFVDFGESSLDFQLRAWTAAARYFNVGSELRVAITQALKEAEIQIPFPQRDLYLRSVDDGVSFKARRDGPGVE